MNKYLMTFTRTSESEPEESSIKMACLASDWSIAYDMGNALVSLLPEKDNMTDLYEYSIDIEEVTK